MSSCPHCDSGDGFWPAWPDVVGASASSLCILHCLTLPISIALLPLWSAASYMHQTLHVVVALLLVPTTLLAMWVGYRRHGSFGPSSILASGLLIVLTALAVGHGGPQGPYAETALTLAGSSLLVAGHWRNWRFSKSALRPCAPSH